MKIELKDIYKSFSGNEVLHGINLSVETGRALGLLGRNGAGKTTTIRILMGLFNADSGEVLLDGQKFKPKEHQIGYLPEERGLYPKKKVLEQLVYLGQLRGFTGKEAKESALYWLERLGVGEYKNSRLETLSKGNQQKVQIVQTFLCNPDIIILDEPFSGLDPVNAQILKDIIRELIGEDKLLIFSSHQMGYVEEFCDEIALIDKGKIVLTGNLKNIKRDHGMNRLTISSVSMPLEDLENNLNHNLSHIIKVAEKKKNFLVIELINNNTKNELLRALSELQLDIERFTVYEPTLEDIFVKKVGENS